MQLTTEDLYNIVVILVIAIVAARYIKRRQERMERLERRGADPEVPHETSGSEDERD